MKRILSIAICALLAGCTPPPPTAGTPEKKDANAAVLLVQRVNNDAYARTREASAAQWIAATYINEDSQLLAAKASERDLAYQAELLDELRQFQGVDLDPNTRRSFDLMLNGRTVLPPVDASERAELTTLSAKLEAAYGAATACGDDPSSCRDLMALSEVLATSRDPAVLAKAWQDWHDTAAASRLDYQRFAELMNSGAKAYGFADTGDLWRSGYDMPAADFAAEVERLWSEVEPLYRQMHCYVRGRLNGHYGDSVVSKRGPIPGHVLGNMWQQDWSSVYDLVEPFPGVASLNVSEGLRRAGYDAIKLTRQAEGFYTSLGMPALPELFWERSMLTKPADRDVQCHASAWDIDMKGDVRIKMCIVPDEENLRTVYHELGHIYYYLAYHGQPPLYQTGANDGFHEAIGDTIVLSLTPGYLAQIGLIESADASEQATINAQMKLALEKVAFLPFGKLIDQWRWGVFDASIAPANFNAAWWDLKRKYQGVVPPVERDESDFDPGAKYHVPANTPYTRYFLAHILQFQFHRSMCQQIGHKGPLHTCSIFGNQEIGAKFWKLLAAGASQPWQQTLKEFTGSERMQADAVIEYFAPLNTWLTEQNRGQSCGW